MGKGKLRWSGSSAAGIVLATCLGASLAEAQRVSRSIDELKALVTIHLGKTADWVAITPDGVWVGGTGPDAVHKIDPVTNTRMLTVNLPGEPCSGLALGFGSLWIPLCGGIPTLAKVDLKSGELADVFKVGPAAAEGGVATSPDSVWLVTDKHGTLARIDPANGAIRQTVQVPSGSYNPHYVDGRIWVTRAGGSELTSIDAATGALLGSTRTGPAPRFLTSGAGAVWTLNQGDGSLSRIDIRTHRATTIALGIPGHGGDIAFGGGMVWTTLSKVPLSLIDPSSPALLCQWRGAGGDSLGIGHGSLWLTDYHGGSISRFDLTAAVQCCKATRRTIPIRGTP